MRMRGRSYGNSRFYQVAGDQHLSGTHRHQHDYELDDAGISGLFHGRGPGRLVILAGMAIAGFGFVGWASIVFGFWHQQEPPQDMTSMLGAVLPSGLPVGIAYFLGFGLGAVLMKIGSSMAKAARRGSGFFGHLVAAVLLLGLTGVAVVAMVGGASWDLLAPDFTR